MDRSELVSRRLREALADGGTLTIAEAETLVDYQLRPTLDSVLASAAFVLDGDMIRAAS